MKKIALPIIMFFLMLALRVNAQEYHLGQVVENPDGSRGVVYYLNEDGTQGWMVGLHDVAVGIPWGLADHIENLDEVTVPDHNYINSPLLDVDGYAHTLAIIQHYQNQGFTGQYAAKMVDIENGWYLPAAGQLKMLYVNAIFYEQALESVGEKMGLHPYWSSTVESDEKAWYVHFGSPYAQTAWANNAYLALCARNETTPSSGGPLAVRPIRDLHFSSSPYVGLLHEPAVICGEGPLDLVMPSLYNVERYGWEMASDVDFTDPVPYTGQALDANYNGWYLRLWATAEEEVLYSNVVRIRVFESSESFTTVSHCGPYFWNGQIFEESGVYSITLTNQWGCDSIATLNLTVHDPDDYFIPYPVYGCNSYEWGDMTITQSGSYSQTFTNQYGCDSTVTMSLYLQETVEHQFMDLGCGEYDWNGELYYESGVYQHTFSLPNGCDSIVTLNLTIKDAPVVGEIQGEDEIYYLTNGEFTYRIDPVEGAMGYAWSIDNEWMLTSSVDSPECTVYVSTRDRAILTVRVFTECGYVDRTLLIRHDHEPGFNIFPNPTDGDLTILLYGMKGKVTIRIHDMLGQFVGQYVVDTEVDGNNLSYTLKGKPAGVYSFTVIYNYDIITQKVIKRSAAGYGVREWWW